MSVCQIIALVLTSETIGIDSENYLLRKLKSDHAKDFPHLINRNNFNRRRKRLYPLLADLNIGFVEIHNEAENAKLVDSIPVPVCQKAWEK